MIMLKNKNYLYLLFIVKYALILTITPELENQRFYEFFNSCSGFCLNPYENIQDMYTGSLSFPYGYVMYFFLVPFFFIAKLLSLSFIILSYIFVEIFVLKLLMNFFDTEIENLILPVVLNPIIIYSVVFKGYLDFIPLVFFILCLNNFKNKKHELAIFYLALGIGTKVVLILILPLLITYIYKNSSDIKKIYKLTGLSSVLVGLVYVPMTFNAYYSDSVLRGISEGARVLQFSGIFNLNTLIISEIIIFITYYFFWKNVRKMDYFGLVVCLGICTFPLFILNFSNIGWFMWSLPAIIYIFISIDNSRKYLIYLYFSSVVIVDNKFFNEFVNENLIALQFFFSLIVLRYFYQFLIQNKYFRIKSKPIMLSIAGDSGVGKSSITSILYNFFGSQHTTIIEIDNYHKYERSSNIWETKTHLDPTVNKLTLYKKQLIEIISGNVEQIREYNHLTGRFDESRNIKINDFLLVEGLHPLSMKDLNKFYNLKVYLGLEKQLKDDFKLKRDLERNKSKKDIEKQIKARGEDFKKYIEPQEDYADLTLNTVELSKNDIVLDLVFQTEYLEELIDILEDNNIKLLKTNYSVNKAELRIKSSKDNTNLCKDLTKDLNNIKDDLFEFEKNEIDLKSAFIIYFLSKKLELI